MKKLWIPAFAVMTAILIFLFSSAPVLAVGGGSICDLSVPNGGCEGDTICQRIPKDGASGFKAGEYRCISPPSNPGSADVFGKVIPPSSIVGFGFGSVGIGKFLSNLVALIYSLAIVVLIFMLLWGAFDWMTSEGDKEKIERARNKIINAIIGILIFAAAFGIIQILGTFTGFKFFEG